MRNADGVQIFYIDNDPLSSDVGQLTPLQGLEDGTDGTLVGAAATTAVTVGDKIFLLAAARNAGALNVYEIGGGDDVIEGTNSADEHSGGSGADSLVGLGGADMLDGGSGNDLIRGGADGDVLIGGAGSDTLWGEGGADVLEFANVDQSPHGSGRDVIADFEAGVGVIDLSGFAGTLTFVAGYTGSGNEVRYNDGVGRLYIEVDGDSASDFSVDLTPGSRLTESNLIL